MASRVACKSQRDGHGTSYFVPAAVTQQTPGKRTLRGFPEVQVWWSRLSNKDDETLIIRQEYEDRKTADVIEITLGQLYDLIDALNKAVETA
jgi:hypothetical protein